MRKASDSSKVISLLSKLHTKYPTYNMARHISTAVSDYGDIWGMTDRELLFALEKYSTTLDMDSSPIEDEAYVNRIVREGMDLDNILNEQDDEEEDY